MRYVKQFCVMVAWRMIICSMIISASVLWLTYVGGVTWGS